MEQSRTLRLTRTVPNLITAFSLTLALVSIFFSLQGNFEQAAWFVTLCVLADKLDGTAARLLKADSELGVQLDSLADFIAFNLAPTLMVVSLLTNGESPFAVFPASLLVYSSAVVFVIGGAARLARFNTSAAAGTGPQLYFQGLPTTICGALVATLYLTVSRYLTVDQYAVLFPPLLLLLALMMVSPLYLPKIGRRKAGWINVFQVANVVLVPVLVLIQQLPEYLLFLALSYIVVGLIVANRKGTVIR